MIGGIIRNHNALARLQGIIMARSGESKHLTLPTCVEIFIAIGLPSVLSCLLTERGRENQSVEILHLIAVIYDFKIAVFHVIQLPTSSEDGLEHER